MGKRSQVSRKSPSSMNGIDKSKKQRPHSPVKAPRCRKKLQLSQTLITDTLSSKSAPAATSSPASKRRSCLEESTICGSKILRCASPLPQPITTGEGEFAVELEDPNQSIIIEEDYPDLTCAENSEAGCKMQEQKQYEAGDKGLEALDKKMANSTISPCSEELNHQNLSLVCRHRVVECGRSDDGQQLRLVVKPEFSAVSNVKKICMLRDSWLSTPVNEGDVLNILTNWYQLWDENDENVELAIIDRTSGFVVVQPDTLISGTSLVTSLVCRRKAVLAERFKLREFTDGAMLRGTLVHRLFQKALLDKTADIESLQRILAGLLGDPFILKELFGASVTADEMEKEVNEFIPSVKSFIECYFLDGSQQKLAENNQTGPHWGGRIESVCDIEDNWWSPRLGVKGKVDVTVQVKGRKVPLEVKTGRPAIADDGIKGQVRLYTMMMRGKELPYKPHSGESEDTDGLLLYLSEGGRVQHIPAGFQEQQGLVQLRNEVMDHLRSVTDGCLPAKTERIAMCSSCPYRTECSIYAEDASDQGFASHLSQNHRKYFTDWSRMLQLEEEESRLQAQPLSDIWCRSPDDRQADGRCLAHLKVQDCQSSLQKVSEMSQYLVTLAPCKTEHVSFLKSDFEVGDYVALSTNDRIALATGSIVQIGPSSVVVATERDVTRIAHVVHLDQLGNQGSKPLLYTNLSRLMADNARAARLRQLVVDLKPPRFRKGFSNSLTDKVLGEAGRSILEPLNPLQQKAVLMALICKDYCLFDGLPGTGKTSLIVALIRLAVLCGLSVLLTSYTHSAVDNVLLKLTEANFKDFVRLGRTYRIHQDIRPYGDEVKSLQCRTVDDVGRIYSVPLVAATCLAVSHPAISNRKDLFDLCIVDEAAQILQAAVIGPLATAKRFVLVGDPRQLPPVVQSQKAKRMGMDVSLFQRLSVCWPTDVIRLRQQYRMCGPLNALANKLAYAGDLLCANPQVEAATLPAPRSLSDGAIPTWLANIVKAGLDHAILFVDTSLLPFKGQKHNQQRRYGCPVNILEANLAVKIVSTLKDMNDLDFSQVGIISPYRSQVQHLRQLVQESMAGLEVNTVDQYQGRDKSVILYTCTKVDSYRNLDAVDTSTSETELKSDDNNDNLAHNILNDLRRLAVAVTRAKYKLIIIGHGSTLHQYGPFARLMDNLESSQRYILRSGRDGFDITSFTSST